MSAPALSSTREALSGLLSLTGEDGSPIGPTAPGDLNGEFSSAPQTADRADIERLIDELRALIGLDQLPGGSVSFFERLYEEDEEYHLRYKLSPARPSGRTPTGSPERKERLVGQIDAGTVLTLTRRVPAPEDESSDVGNQKSDNRNSESRKAALSAEIQQTEELDSGATVKTDTTWTGSQLGPVELGALEGFFRPATDLLQREQ